MQITHDNLKKLPKYNHILGGLKVGLRFIKWPLHLPNKAFNPLAGDGLFPSRAAKGEAPAAIAAAIDAAGSPDIMPAAAGGGTVRAVPGGGTVNPWKGLPS